MKQLFYTFLNFLRSLFSQPIELTEEDYSEAYEIDDKTLSLKLNNKLVQYQRTSKYDIVGDKMTYYAWNNGKVYTTTLRGNRVRVLTNPMTNYTLIGYGKIF